jgi:hypothetical protein
VVSGRWPFSSGVDNSQWNMLAVTVYGDDGKTPVDWRLCLVPKKDYAIIDTWYAMGMVGTGSKDIEVKEVFVPERRALALGRCRGGREHPGAALNDGALFRVPIVAFDAAPGRRVALVAHGGKPLEAVDLSGPVTFVLGSEREGLPEEELAKCDEQATVPLAASAESLNVATAGAIGLYARRR